MEVERLWRARYPGARRWRAGLGGLAGGQRPEPGRLRRPRAAWPRSPSPARDPGEGGRSRAQLPSPPGSRPKVANV